MKSVLSLFSVFFCYVRFDTVGWMSGGGTSWLVKTSLQSQKIPGRLSGNRLIQPTGIVKRIIKLKSQWCQSGAGTRWNCVAGSMKLFQCVPVY